MWGWILDQLLKLALSWGLPALVAWAFEKFPWLQKFVPNLYQILEDLIKALQGAETRAGRIEAKTMARERIKKECFGVACPPSTKKS